MYETDECGSVLSERRTRLHYGTEKNEGTVRDKKELYL